MTLTNQTRNNSLGSANVTAPAYAQLVGGTATLSSSGTATVNTATNTIELRDLNLSTSGSPATVTIQAVLSPGSGQSWTSVAKQSNSFADAPGPGNLFTLQGDPPPLTVAECTYVFTQQPVDTQTNAAQTVKVQLRAGTTPVSVSEGLTLTAHQTVGTTTNQVSTFTGLTSSSQDATKTWIFSTVVGTVSGAGYKLRAGTGAAAVDSTSFTIYDCVPTGPSDTCDIPFTPTGDGTSGGSVSGTGIGSGIALSFETIPQAAMHICGALAPDGWDWSPLTFPETDGRTNFDGLVLSDFTYSKSTGFLKVTSYLRNDLYVMTSPSNTNDIQICAGARHADSANATTQGSTSRAFMGRDNIKAKWDTSTGLYWGVLARIPNCNRARDLPDGDGVLDGILDPALCAWGTVDIGGVLYRSATVLVPYDWDWKGVT